MVSQFNDGLYDIIIAADENSLRDPQTVKPDLSTNRCTHKHKLVIACHIMYLCIQLCQLWYVDVAKLRHVHMDVSR